MITATPLAAGCRLPETLLAKIGWPAPGAQAAVVLFVRGAWCPVCRRQIARFAAGSDELAALGVPLFILSTGDISEFTRDPLLGVAGDAAVRPEDVAVRLPVDWDSVDPIPPALSAIMASPATVDVPLDDVVPGEQPVHQEAHS